MRIIHISASLALVLTSAACATSPTMSGGYNSELRQLSADCQARGGILAPTGQQSGRPQNDNICELRNGGGRLPNR